MIKPTSEVLMEQAFEDCDGCMSCGWHSAWYEVEGSFKLTGREGFPNEYWAPCSKDEGDDVSDHRGYYIYPKI